MARPRLVLLLPLVFVLLTLGLWACARMEYQSFIHPGPVYDPRWEMWTDYVPFPLELAGALNVPVATFAYPTYQLLHRETSIWTLLALLVGVAAQWSYVGWTWDNRAIRSQRGSRTLAAIGVLFGVFVFLVSLPMHHVALIYRAAAVLWSICICWHFGKVLTRPVVAKR